jgi:hypothetical protein
MATHRELFNGHLLQSSIDSGANCSIKLDEYRTNHIRLVRIMAGMQTYLTKSKKQGLSPYDGDK